MQLSNARMKHTYILGCFFKIYINQLNLTLSISAEIDKLAHNFYLSLSHHFTLQETLSVVLLCSVDFLKLIYMLL